MSNADIIYKYFPDLSTQQKERFKALDGLYKEWNGKINVISRKGIDELYTQHILHSLAIAKVCNFTAGSRVLDVGCGGGFPAIPLAILFPDVKFTLCDSIGKKIKVVNAIIESLGLENASGVNMRAEQIEGKFDFVVSRAVTTMKEFTPLVWTKIDAKSGRGSLGNGILYLKGGDLELELAECGMPFKLYNISDYFSEDFFETKKVVYIEKK